MNTLKTLSLSAALLAANLAQAQAIPTAPLGDEEQATYQRLVAQAMREGKSAREKNRPLISRTDMRDSRGCHIEIGAKPETRSRAGRNDQTVIVNQPTLCMSR